ncbi:MAG: DUF3575 domain-containing protein [Muribaculaceae bacterium]|nr:DUF3575 domain-containing protein [Muribaculaceae bacterium]
MRLIALAFAVVTALASFAGPTNDSVRVYFLVGHHRFDPSLGENREAMDRFIVSVKEAVAENSIDSIIVEAYASPDGTNKANTLLAKRRCDDIAALIIRKAGVSDTLIYKNPRGIAWDELRDLVAATPDVPSREKVLDVIDNVPVWVFNSDGKVIGGRKKSLMEIDGGRPYRWMYAHLFPKLRNAVAVTLVTTHEDAPESAPDEDTVIPEEEVTAPEPVEPISTKEPADTANAASLSIDAGKAWKDSRFALKTNLLDYAVLMPNLELEWMFADRWSAALEAQGAWYAKTTPHKVYRLATIMPEVRYWVIDRSRWHGMYVGLFGGIGQYDLCDGHKGHEGEGAMGGLSVGYMWPIGKHLSLDAGIGLGYMRLRDKEYLPADGHFLYQLTKNINYVGPLRLKLSLVWRFQCNK